MPGGQWKTNIDGAVSNEDWSVLVQLARREPAKTLRYLTSRLCSADAPLKWKAVRALAAVAGDREGMSENRIRRLLQRFLWLLTDESGNVPYGVPEAFGEVLVARPEFQAEFLPLLCSLAYDPERIQTGPIEREVSGLWVESDSPPRPVRRKRSKLLTAPPTSIRNPKPEASPAGRGAGFD